jgi:carbamoyl-phosphate synthase large subunit
VGHIRPEETQLRSEPRKPNILVTGVGGGAGQSILKALEETPYGVVGVDSEELAAGLHAVSRAYKGYYAADPRFVDRLLEICRREECGLIFAGHDAELLPLSEHAARFRSEGIVPVVSSPEIIRICDDKLATHAFLKAHGFSVPNTQRLNEFTTFCRPVVLKPQRGGARSRNTFVVRSSQDLSLHRLLVDPDNCVVQEYIEGDEYTCGTVTLDDRCAGVILMRRILRDGDTHQAFVERNPALESSVRSIAEALRPFGACNIQLRVRNGEPFVFEINARCSGTTAARALAGFNEPKMIAGYLLDKIAPACSIREISILRYWKELVVSNGRIEQLRDTSFLPGDGTRL